jgi:hypothetical protein
MQGSSLTRPSFHELSLQVSPATRRETRAKTTSGPDRTRIGDLYLVKATD